MFLMRNIYALDPRGRASRRNRPLLRLTIQRSALQRETPEVET
jgi:hypothetical protein